MTTGSFPTPTPQDLREEIRHDPISGHAVLVAPARALRPHDFAEVPSSDTATSGARGPCPFCEGNEWDTPGEVLARRTPGSAPDAPGWTIRVVPNKFPALGGPGATGPGMHEVIIEAPRHAVRVGDLSRAEFTEVLAIYAERMAALARTPSIAYGVLFKNVGAAAGASLEHAHSQLLALPFVPPLALAELSGAAAWHAREGSCYWCQLIASECSAGLRVIAESPQFVALAPFASRFAYEVCIVPRFHRGDFHCANPEELGELASMIQTAIAKLERALRPPGGSEPLAYNYYVHTLPFASAKDSSSGRPDSYHWHVEIVPRLSNVAGFEWGSGSFINAVPPEFAARHLRDL